MTTYRESQEERLEDLKFKHMFIDTWIKEQKYESQLVKTKKLEKLRMKEEIVKLEQELNG